MRVERECMGDSGGAKRKPPREDHTRERKTLRKIFKNFGEAEIWAQKEGRTYLRPATGTWKSLNKDAFDAPQVGAQIERALLVREIFQVSWRTAAEATRKIMRD